MPAVFVHGVPDTHREWSSLLARIARTDVNLADNIARLNLGVDRILPLHGRIVPLAELHRGVGRGN